MAVGVSETNVCECAIIILTKDKSAAACERRWAALFTLK